MTVDELVIELRAETRKLRRGLDNVNKKLNKTEKTAKKTSNAMSKIGGAVATIGFAALGLQLISTIRKFEDLEATLRAVTGSTAAASKSFELIRAFTARTVFQVDEVARSFITLKQAGIVPTSEVLQDFGNFAAGMGKSIEQLAQAAFNATTGEMEMLKQFGVVARQQGDKITVTFDGVTKEIERSGESIVAFLREIGSTTFSTAIEERFKTLSGAIANLNDILDEFQVQIGEAGATEGLVNLTKATTETIDELDVFAVTLGVVFGQIANITAFFVSAIASVLGFFNTIEKGTEDLTELDKALERLIKLNKDFKTGFSADEKREFAIFEKLQADIEGARISLDTLVNDDMADLERIVRRAAELQAEAQLSSFVGPLSPKQRENQIQANLDQMLGGLSMEEYKEKVRDFLDANKGLTEGIISMQRAIQASSERFTTDFVDSLLEGQSGLEAFRDFSKSVISQIISIFLQLEVVNRILAAVFPALGVTYGGVVTPQGGGKTGSTGRGGGAPFTFQSGGAVQRNTPIMVGEAGPEMFVPHSAGNILNHMNTNQAMNGGGVVINQSLNFSTGVVPTVRAEVTKMLPQISDVTKGAVLEAAMRGGNFRKGLLGG